MFIAVETCVTCHASHFIAKLSIDHFVTLIINSLFHFDFYTLDGLNIFKLFVTVILVIANVTSMYVVTLNTSCGVVRLRSCHTLNFWMEIYLATHFHQSV